jgi:DNA-binding NtrC family response regulator
MDHRLGLITQDRGLERIMRRISNDFGYELSLYEECGDFVNDFGGNEQGVVVIDGFICSQPRLMDLQFVLNEVPTWQVLYLPRTNKRNEVKEVMELRTFGILHRPVSEKEIRQMLESALGILEYRLVPGHKQPVRGLEKS